MEGERAVLEGDGERGGVADGGVDDGGQEETASGQQAEVAAVPTHQT